MWALDNDTPYAAERNWTRDKQGVHRWLVAVRATYDIGPTGQLSLVDPQPPPQLEPEYRGEPGKSSLRVDSDLLAEKPGTDVILDACAHAPRGRAATTVPVSLRVGPLEKTLVVHGPRLYYRGALALTTTAPKAFTTQPIHYEWAYGGFDTSAADPRKHRLDARNPVGRGFAVETDRLVHQPAHTVEYPSGNAAKAGPAGFGPIDRSWSPRLERAGTYDERWVKAKKPLLPDDYDDRYALCAPADQSFPKPLRGGEEVTLVNLTPEGALRFELPKLFFAFSSRFGTRREEHGAHLVTVFIESEKRRVSLTWQTALPVPARQVEQLDKTNITEKQYLR
jgi:hypothetical protein